LQSAGPSQLVTPEASGQHGAKVDVEIDRLQSQDTQQMGQKIVVADKRRLMAGQAAVLQGHRLYPDMRPLGRMKELAMESQHLMSAGRRTFGKYQQTDTPAQ
jgi:hypothetical protein